MEKFFILSGLYGRFSRLTNAQLHNPAQVLKEFYKDFNYTELEVTLKHMVESCLTSNHTAFRTPAQRENLLYKQARIEQLFQAILALLVKHEQDNA